MENPSESIHESESMPRDANSPLSEEEYDPSTNTKESMEDYLFRLIIQIKTGGWDSMEDSESRGGRQIKIDSLPAKTGGSHGVHSKEHGYMFPFFFPF